MKSFFGENLNHHDDNDQLSPQNENLMEELNSNLEDGSIESESLHKEHDFDNDQLNLRDRDLYSGNITEPSVNSKDLNIEFSSLQNGQDLNNEKSSLREQDPTGNTNSEDFNRKLTPSHSSMNERFSKVNFRDNNIKPASLQYRQNNFGDEQWRNKKNFNSDYNNANFGERNIEPTSLRQRKESDEIRNINGHNPN